MERDGVGDGASLDTSAEISRDLRLILSGLSYEISNINITQMLLTRHFSAIEHTELKVPKKSSPIAAGALASVCHTWSGMVPGATPFFTAFQALATALVIILRESASP